jgi:uncharacterized protein with NAD-binding domain and iron-sulfur cluster
MKGHQPQRVAIVGGGCASIATAFELTRPELRRKYQVTIYQQGWRLGGKGASGRGVANRIEEHGLHVWLGCYDNAFMLLRQCYEELNVDGCTGRFATWRDGFIEDSHIGVRDAAVDTTIIDWTAIFPPGPGLPGDPVRATSALEVRHYFHCMLGLLKTLLFGLGNSAEASTKQKPGSTSSAQQLTAQIQTILRLGIFGSSAALSQLVGSLEAAASAVPQVSDAPMLRVIGSAASEIRRKLDELVYRDHAIRFRAQIVDLVVAVLVGTIRDDLLTHANGFDSINKYDFRAWLRLNGASENSLTSPFLCGLYDFAFAYDAGDPKRPALGAGSALRGALRMFFGYRGALMWKMKAGMGDVVFAPFYELLSKRGVHFEFFHRLERVRVSKPIAKGAPRHVTELQFDIQARTTDGKRYNPLINVRGLKCWPSEPDFTQLAKCPPNVNALDFECSDGGRAVGTRSLRVSRDFDFVVLGVSIGVLSKICKDIVKSDPRWSAMIHNVKTTATQAFQIWLNKDLQRLGWYLPPITLSSLSKPFDTWADMGQVIPAENWSKPPRTVAYFCGVLPDRGLVRKTNVSYVKRRKAEVRRNAIKFLTREAKTLWPKAFKRGNFQWNLLVDPGGKSTKIADATRFDTQFWTANVNLSDRYVLSLPGSQKYRISPLDRTYDNMTIAGDWTQCGYDLGCVEAAFMSGRLAAHAISQSPSLSEIVGYNMP